MAYIQNVLIFAVLCIIAGAHTQASSGEHGSQHIHHKVPLDPSDAERRPPHIHGVAPHFPPGFHPILGRPPHHNSEEATQDPSDADRRPPHIHDDASSEHRPPHIHDEAPLNPSDADRRPPHIYDDASSEDRPPHIHDEAPQDPSDADRRPPHIHDDASSEHRPPHIHNEAPLNPSDADRRPPHIHEVPHDKPFQFDMPDWIPISPGVNWTPCDIDAGPRVRCHDCHTRLICTRLGGFVIDCPDASYCRNGLCSDAPIAGCR